jgi:hypothetical protein
MPTPRLRRRGLQPTRRHALELLASCPDGATDTLLMATHGLTTEMLVDLIRDGLATGRTEQLVIAGHTREIMRVWITEAGRRVLAK